MANGLELHVDIECMKGLLNLVETRQTRTDCIEVECIYIVLD